jgi:hypothetical protein
MTSWLEKIESLEKKTKWENVEAAKAWLELSSELRNSLPQILAVVRIAEECLDDDSTCPRCEGGGRLSADGLVHSQSEWLAGIATRDCPQCGGSGKINGDALSRLHAAISALNSKPESEAKR